MSEAFFDTECFPNYWLLKIKAKGSMYTFRLLESTIFSGHEVATIQGLLSSHTMVSFNGIKYDAPMIALALSGANTRQLKRVSDMLIVDNIQHWQLNLPALNIPDHIDIMNVAPGIGGQKQYAGRLHLPQLQDLPYEPGAILTSSQMTKVDQYCEHDVQVLESLYGALQPQLRQRIALGVRHGLDLRSKSDAQVSEAIIRLRCEQAVGSPIFKPKTPNCASFRYAIPAFINFSHPDLQHAKSTIEHAVFSIGGDGKLDLPQALTDLNITIGKSSYSIGIGGLHSREKRLTLASSETHVLMDADVISYYPQLIINSGKYPPALGPAFQQVYQSMKTERLAAKAEQKRRKAAGEDYRELAEISDGLKIQLNSPFGNMGNIHSILFAPELLIYTTITGQLSLLMLIEWHEHINIHIRSANTDGIVIECPRQRVQESQLLIKTWERVTGLEMEVVEYQLLHMKDVNNYVALPVKGEPKRKGVYGKGGLVEKKNPNVEICSDAVVDWLANRTPIEYTIYMCRDIRKFIRIQKVAGGAIKRHEGFMEQPTEEYLGVVVRWYYGVDSPGPIVYKKNGNKVGTSEGSVPCMTLPDIFPSNVDYQWYIKQAYKLLTSTSI